MPCSGTAAKQLIREPSSCPAFQAASSSYPMPGGAMQGKERGMASETTLYSVGGGRSGFVQRGTLGGTSKAESPGWGRGRGERGYGAG